MKGLKVSTVERVIELISVIATAITVVLRKEKHSDEKRQE